MATNGEHVRAASAAPGRAGRFFELSALPETSFGAAMRSVCRGASIEGPWTLSGATDRDATARMKDLLGSGVPLPFECIHEDTYGKREY